MAHRAGIRLEMQENTQSLGRCSQAQQAWKATRLMSPTWGDSRQFHPAWMGSSLIRPACSEIIMVHMDRSQCPRLEMYRKTWDLVWEDPGLTPTTPSCPTTAGQTTSTACPSTARVTCIQEPILPSTMDALMFAVCDDPLLVLDPAVQTHAHKLGLLAIRVLPKDQQDCVILDHP